MTVTNYGADCASPNRICGHGQLLEIEKLSTFRRKPSIHLKKTWCV